MTARSSTPKYEVVHDSGTVAVTGVSRTEATEIARAMNRGAKVKRLSVRPVRKPGAPLTTNQMVAIFAQVLA